MARLEDDEIDDIETLNNFDFDLSKKFNHYKSDSQLINKNVKKNF